MILQQHKWTKTFLGDQFSQKLIINKNQLADTLPWNKNLRPDISISNWFSWNLLITNSWVFLPKISSLTCDLQRIPGRNLISHLGGRDWARNWNDPVENFLVHCRRRNPMKWIATESRYITHRRTFHATLQAPNCKGRPREWRRRVHLLRGTSPSSSGRVAPRLSGGTCIRQADNQ